MTTPPSSRTVDMFAGRLNIIWIAMLASVGVYVTITLFIQAGGEPPLDVDLSPQLLPTLKAALALVSAADIAVIYFIDSKFKSREGLQKLIERNGVSDEEEKTNALMAHYFQLCLIKWALAESVAIYGLILSLLTAETLTPSLFYLVAAIFLGNLRPNRTEIEELLRSV